MLAQTDTGRLMAVMLNVTHERNADSLLPIQNMTMIQQVPGRPFTVFTDNQVIESGKYNDDVVESK